MYETEIVLTLLGTAARLARRLDSSLSMIKGISFSEYQLLAALRGHPATAATRVDLASAVGLTPSGITRALKPMEKLGFVETTKDGRDARKSLAALTAAGVELVADADGVVHDALAKVGGLDQLSVNERELFVRILSDLAGP